MKFFDKLKENISDLYEKEETGAPLLIAAFLLLLVAGLMWGYGDSTNHQRWMDWILIGIGIFELVFVELMFWFSTPKDYVRCAYEDKWFYTIFAKLGYFCMGIFVLANITIGAMVIGVVVWFLYLLLMSKVFFTIVGTIAVVVAFVWLNTLRLNGVKNGKKK
jgi:hypothetical protein